MEIRCGGCNKLFRIPDEKITGKGIKFSCTRCHETVKVTKEEFEQYTLSKSAVAVPEAGLQESPAEKNIPMEHDPVAKAEEQIEPAAPVSQSETKAHPAEEHTLIPETTTVPEQKEFAKSSGSDIPREEQSPPSAEHEPSFVTPAIPATYAAPAPIRSVPVAPEASSRSVNRFLIFTVILVIIGLAGYGVFISMGPKTQKTEELLKELSSTEGLLISSASGTVDVNGDLLIKCVIENSLDRERPAWYVVVDIYSTQGSTLGKIRAINGKQIYTQRDYDILSKRGINIQEMKTRTLKDQGVTVPPKGSVTFELKYAQPVSGAASFNAMVNPFDPVRMFKELAEEIQQ